MHILHKDDVKKGIPRKEKREEMPETGECHKRRLPQVYSTCTVQVPGTYVLRIFRGRPHWGLEGEDGILYLKDSRERGNVTLGKGGEGMGREVCRVEGDSEEGCI